MSGKNNKSTIAMNIMDSTEIPAHISVGCFSGENFATTVLEPNHVIVVSNEGMAEVAPARITVGDKECQVKHFP